MKRVALLLIMMLAPIALFAQRGSIPALAVISSPGFFTSLIAGIILAFGFQFLLMNVSTAIGLSALHSPLKKAEKRATGSERERARHHESHEESSDVLTDTARKVNAAFGVWAIITASISLFFAAWLAVKLSTAFNLISGVTLGLAIWGLFYVVTSVLEMAAVSSMIGSLVSLVRSGLRSATQTASGILRPSEEHKAGSIAREVTDAVKDEILHDVNLKNTIQGYIEQMRPDYQKIRNELSAVLNNAQVDVKTTYAKGTTTASFHTGTSGPSASEMKEKAQAAAATMREAAGKVSEEARSDKDTAEKIADTMMEMAGMSRQEAEEYRHKVEDYLRSTGKNELNPEGIKRDIDKLVSDNPKAGVDSIMARLNDIDRSTITSILAQRRDMNKDEATRVVDMVAGTLSNLKSKYQQTKQPAGQAGPSTQEQRSIEARVRGYLDSLDNRSLHYDAIKSDFEMLARNPKAGTQSLLHALQSIDRHDLKQIIAHSGMKMNEQDIDNTVDSIEKTRDSLIHRVDAMREEVTSRIQKTEEEVLRRADDTRRVAASAAWWVFGAGLISGIAAGVGGLVGIMF